MSAPVTAPVNPADTLTQQIPFAELARGAEPTKPAEPVKPVTEPAATIPPVDSTPPAAPPITQDDVPESFFNTDEPSDTPVELQWDSFGKELGIEVGENNEEAFVAGFKSYVEKQKQEAINEFKANNAVIDDVSKINDEHIAGEEGIQIAKINGAYQHWIDQDDQALVRKMLELEKRPNGQPMYTPERIDAKMEKFEQNDSLADEADKHRSNLMSYMAANSARYKAIVDDGRQKLLDTAASRKTEAAKAREQAYDGLKDVYGVPLSAKDKAVLLEQYRKGKAPSPENHAEMAKLHAIREYGNKVIDKVISKEEMAAKLKLLKKMRVEPNAQSGAPVRVPQKSDIPFSELMRQNQ